MLGEALRLAAVALGLRGPGGERRRGDGAGQRRRRRRPRRAGPRPGPRRCAQCQQRGHAGDADRAAGRGGGGPRATARAPRRRGRGATSRSASSAWARSARRLGAGAGSSAGSQPATRPAGIVRGLGGGARTEQRDPRVDERDLERAQPPALGGLFVEQRPRGGQLSRRALAQIADLGRDQGLGRERRDDPKRRRRARARRPRSAPRAPRSSPSSTRSHARSPSAATEQIGVVEVRAGQPRHGDRGAAARGASPSAAHSRAELQMAERISAPRPHRVVVARRVDHRLLAQRGRDIAVARCALEAHERQVAREPRTRARPTRARRAATASRRCDSASDALVVVEAPRGGDQRGVWPRRERCAAGTRAARRRAAVRRLGSQREPVVGERSR